jgi:hypothetical protein
MRFELSIHAFLNESLAAGGMLKAKSCPPSQHPFDPEASRTNVLFSKPSPTPSSTKVGGSAHPILRRIANVIPSSSPCEKCLHAYFLTNSFRQDASRFWKMVSDDIAIAWRFKSRISRAKLIKLRRDRNGFILDFRSMANFTDYVGRLFDDALTYLGDAATSGSESRMKSQTILV